MAEREATPPRWDTGLLLYCVGAASSALPGEGLGVQGGALRCVSHGGLTAVVSPLTEPLAAATARLLEYERVIRSRHAVADVLPMRFGSVLPDEAAVRAHLEEQQAAYLRALERISGCVEMSVRALLAPPDRSAAPEAVTPSAIRSGAEYLKARQRRYSAESLVHEQLAALEQALTSKVSALCREHRAELSPSRSEEPALCSLYFLVPRTNVSAFRAALTANTEDARAEISLSGPWPPFNFVQ